MDKLSFKQKRKNDYSIKMYIIYGAFFLLASILNFITAWEYFLILPIILLVCSVFAFTLMFRRSRAMDRALTKGIRVKATVLQHSNFQKARYLVIDYSYKGEKYRTTVMPANKRIKAYFRQATTLELEIEKAKPKNFVIRNLYV